MGGYRATRAWPTCTRTGWEGSPQEQAFSRYGLVVSNPPAGPSGAISRLKALSPATDVLVYFDTTAVDVPGFSGLSIYPGWWLTLAGTTLAAPLDATSTTVTVTNGSRIAANLSTNAGRAGG